MDAPAQRERSAPHLLNQYDVFDGETWEAVLVTMLIAPLAAAYGHRALRMMRR